MNVMFEQGPECQKIFEVQYTDDHFSTSSHVLNQTLYLMLCSDTDNSVTCWTEVSLTYSSTQNVP